MNDIIIYWLTPQMASMARPTAGVRNSMHFSSVGGRGPRTWAIFCCLPSYINKNLSGQGSPGDLVLTWGDVSREAVPASH